MSVKQRLTKFILYRNISTRAFERECGFTYGYVNSIRISIQPDKVSSIATAYPELNMGWIMTGEGNMLKSQENKSEKNEGFEKDYRLVPVYNFDAVAGMGSQNSVIDASEYIERRVPFIGAQEDDISIQVSGNSMAPTYTSGSLILIRKVESWREYFGYGHTFVLILTDGRRILKEVHRSIECPESNVLCVSHNPHYPPEELPRAMIATVYKVISTISVEGF